VENVELAILRRGLGHINHHLSSLGRNALLTRLKVSAMAKMIAMARNIFVVLVMFDLGDRYIDFARYLMLRTEHYRLAIP
jgi:hypothetical protein